MWLMCFISFLPILASTGGPTSCQTVAIDTWFLEFAIKDSSGIGDLLLCFSSSRFNFSLHCAKSSEHVYFCFQLANAIYLRVKWRKMMHPSWVHLGDVERDGSAATSHGCAGTPVVALGSSTQPGSRPAVRAFDTWTPLPTVGSQHKCPAPSTLPHGEPSSNITCSFTPSMTPREDTCSYLQLLSSFTARIYRTVCDQP